MSGDVQTRQRRKEKRKQKRGMTLIIDKKIFPTKEKGKIISCLIIYGLSVL